MHSSAANSYNAQKHAWVGCSNSVTGVGTTHTLTHSITHSRTHTHSLNHSLTHSLTHSLACSRRHEREKAPK
jgi:hypothetical protein